MTIQPATATTKDTPRSSVDRGFSTGPGNRLDEEAIRAGTLISFRRRVLVVAFASAGPVRGLRSGSGWAATTSLDALDAAYGGLSEFISSFNGAQWWSPTRCTGWVVRDLILHLLGDAQRGLVALATHADADPDKDAVTYWRNAPGAPDPEFRGVRALRSMASKSSLRYLASTYAETAAAVRVQARRTPPGIGVLTQGHILRVDDLIATLRSRR